MSTAHINTSQTEGIDPNATYTAYDQTAAITSTNDPSIPGPPFRAGQTVKGSGDSDFVFVKATAAVAAGDMCTISSAFTVAGATTTTALYGGLLGVAVVAIASGSYGWVQRAGTVTGGVAAQNNVQPNVTLYATTTAGLVSSTSTTGNKTLLGITLTASAASTGALTAAVLNYPTVGVTTT